MAVKEKAKQTLSASKGKNCMIGQARNMQGQTAPQDR